MGLVLETHHHQQTRATTSIVDCTKSTHEGRGSREHRVETMAECNKRVEEPPPKEGAPKSTQCGTTLETRGKEIENHETLLTAKGGGPTNTRWSPCRVSCTKRRANATRRENWVHDNSQENGNLAMFPFNRETNQPINPRHLGERGRQNEDSSEECVLETQKST